MLKLLREIDGIETVGALREALADEPEDTRIGDVFGDPLRVGVFRDPDTGGREITVN